MPDVVLQTLRWAGDATALFDNENGTPGGVTENPVEQALLRDDDDATFAAATVSAADGVDAFAIFNAFTALEQCSVDTISFLRVKLRARIAGSDAKPVIAANNAWAAYVDGNTPGLTPLTSDFTDTFVDLPLNAAGSAWTKEALNAGIEIGFAVTMVTDDTPDFSQTIECRVSEFAVEVWGPGTFEPTAPPAGAGAGSFANLSVGGVAGPQTLAGGGAAVATAGVPCKGARMVRFRLKATNAVALAAASVNVGNSPLRSELWLTAAGVGMTTRGTATLRMDQSGGNTIEVVCPDPRGSLSWDFVQLSVTPNGTLGQDVTGFAVDAEVLYDVDPRSGAQAFGQSGVVVSTA